MKKYTTDWKGLSIFFFGLAILYAAILFFQRNPSLGTREIIIGLVAWLAFIGFGVLLMTVFSYALISGNTLKYVWLLFLRRTIDIDSITDINDQPTFKVAKGQFRSLYIFYRDKTGETKWIEFRITIFPEKTLGKLIKDLKQINPRIELNKYSQKLMDSASE